MQTPKNRSEQNTNAAFSASIVVSQSVLKSHCMNGKISTMKCKETRNTYTYEKYWINHIVLVSMCVSFFRQSEENPFKSEYYFYYVVWQCASLWYWPLWYTEIIIERTFFFLLKHFYFIFSLLLLCDRVCFASYGWWFGNVKQCVAKIWKSLNSIRWLLYWIRCLWMKKKNNQKKFNMKEEEEEDEVEQNK